MNTSTKLNCRSVLVVLAVSALCVATATFGQSSGSNHGQALGLGKLEPALEVLDGSNIDPNAVAGVIVQFLDDEAIAGPIGSKQELKKAAKAARRQAIVEAGGTPGLGFDNFPIHAARLPYGALKRLARNPKVTHISIDHVIEGSLQTTAAAVGADLIRAGATGMSSYTGSGITVAVLDSGIDTGLDLQGRVWVRRDFTGNTLSVSSLSSKTEGVEVIGFDKYGHGTHVAGIVAAAASNTVCRGLAPDAKLLDLKVLDKNGQGSTSNVIAALDWCISNKAEYKIRVINLSLGHPVYESHKTDPLGEAVAACVKNGIVVVASAGNYGKNSSGMIVYGGISSPGNHPAAITVGAVNTHDTAVRSDDTIAT